MILQRQANHAEAQQGNDENDDGLQHSFTKVEKAIVLQKGIAP